MQIARGLRYLAAPAYVLGLMAVIFGPLLALPLPPAPKWLVWGMPTVSVAKADRLPPAPPIAEIPPKIEARVVKVEIIKKPKPTKRDKRCDGPARYEAMREAFEKSRPQPC